MKILYDYETDSVYVKFSTDTIIESEEVKKDVVDYNDKDEIVFVEVLKAKINPYEIDIPTILKSV